MCCCLVIRHTPGAIQFVVLHIDSGGDHNILQEDKKKIGDKQTHSFLLVFYGLAKKPTGALISREF